MNLKITGRHMEMTDAIKVYVENGLGRLRQHFDKVLDADVILSVEKHRHIAEMNLHANGVRIHSKEVSQDMYASIDAVLAKLDRQIRKYKDRINRHQPRTAKEAREYQHQIIEMPEEEPANGGNGIITVRHRVVHREQLGMRPMSIDEAVLQLELVDDAFLVFSNADTQQVNVLYAREDGTYGLIEPQF